MADHISEHDTLLACSRCATCLPACPSYGATMLETHSPRGRVQLVLALQDGRLSPSPRLRAALNACLDCRACESVCPNGIHPGQLAVETRARIQSPAPFSRWLKRFLLQVGPSRHGLMGAGALATRLAYQRTGIQHLLRASGVLRLAPQLARMDGMLPAIPARAVLQSVPETVPAVGTPRGRVGFFVGCAMNTLFADTTRHSIAALSLLGFDVVVPRRAVCCGAPQVSLGEPDLARAMARRNVGWFDGFDAVVTDCAACGAELKHYGELLGDAASVDFSSRVKDFSEFVEPLMPELAPQPGSVTYHAPCHLAHAQGVCRPPKAILRRVYADFREMAEHDRCCGSAGLYWATQPAIAQHAQARKLAAVRATGAETVVTANPGCMLQLMAGRTAEDRWQVAHMSDVVCGALKGGIT